MHTFKKEGHAETACVTFKDEFEHTTVYCKHEEFDGFMAGLIELRNDIDKAMKPLEYSISLYHVDRTDISSM